jgi:shikimate kinase
MMIILLGYMGSGKSLVGKLLAEKLAYDFIDLDHFMEEKERISIAELFKGKGELYFRKKESLYLKEILTTQKETVIALGGGTPCYGDNMTLILKHTPYVFYLKAALRTLVNRLEKDQNSRPLLGSLKKEDLPDFVRKHLFERSYFYLKAPHSIAVDNSPPEDIAKKIQQKLIL